MSFITPQPMDKPTTFPGAFVWDIARYLEVNLDANGNGVRPSAVLDRPLSLTDPDMTVCVIDDAWMPGKGAIGQRQAMDQQYQIEVWGMAKDLDKAAGRARHGILARNIRRLLAEDRLLWSTLSQNEDTYDSNVERFLLAEVTEQKFHSNEVNAQWAYLSITTLKIRTENTRA